MFEATSAVPVSATAVTTVIAPRNVFLVIRSPPSSVPLRARKPGTFWLQSPRPISKSIYPETVEGQEKGPETSKPPWWPWLKGQDSYSVNLIENEGWTPRGIL